MLHRYVAAVEVCAVKINLHELLLENRYRLYGDGSVSWSERNQAWKGVEKASLNRKLMNMGNGKTGRSIKSSKGRQPIVRRSISR